MDLKVIREALERADSGHYTYDQYGLPITDWLKELCDEVESLRGLAGEMLPYVTHMRDEIEARYDDPDSEYYDDGAQYHDMRGADELIAKVRAVVQTTTTNSL